jgi:DNA mismatch repair protein MutL
MNEATVENSVEQLLTRLAFADIDAGEFAHEAILSIAKSNAIKNGKLLSGEEMEDILSRLFQTKEPQFTPNGKPIIYSQTKEEILNQF